MLLYDRNANEVRFCIGSYFLDTQVRYCDGMLILETRRYDEITSFGVRFSDGFCLIPCL